MRMILEQSMRWRRSDTGEEMLEMFADAIPDGARVQLLRSLGYPVLEQGGDAHERCPGLRELGMQPGEGDRLPRMFGPAPHRGHQPRPAGDRLASRLRMQIGRAHV